MRHYHKIAVVRTTVASKHTAQKLSALILKKRLGACVQISPIKSFYRWHGKTESADEFLVTIKTTLSIAAKCTAFIKKNHPYELPEIMITGVQADNAYARWVAGEVKHEGFGGFSSPSSPWQATGYSAKENKTP